MRGGLAGDGPCRAWPPHGARRTARAVRGVARRDQGVEPAARGALAGAGGQGAEGRARAYRRPAIAGDRLCRFQPFSRRRAYRRAPGLAQRSGVGSPPRDDRRILRWLYRGRADLRPRRRFRAGRQPPQPGAVAAPAVRRGAHRAVVRGPDRAGAGGAGGCAAGVQPDFCRLCARPAACPTGCCRC